MEVNLWRSRQLRRPSSTTCPAPAAHGPLAVKQLGPSFFRLRVLVVVLDSGTFHGFTREYVHICDLETCDERISKHGT
jgi:hypothetical protein